MKISLHLCRMLTTLLPFGSPLFVTGQNEPPILSDSVHSLILNETRELRVMLPREYRPGSANRYEVLYILDGEWCREAACEPGVFNASYIVSLAKGKYPLRLKLLHNIARLGTDQWLDNAVLKF